jgi:hypothetical protein
MSSFAWLDFSEHDRRRALEVIDLFREKETVDELGIGTVRDAFSELLHPGTSVIHTRAKYFLFIPWIYLRLERRKVPSDRIAWEARKAELQLVQALLASNDSAGTIGKLAGPKLKILGTRRRRRNRIASQHGVFRVVTQDWTYEMSKASSTRSFPGVSRSRSYRESGVYHYPRVPKAAEPFRVDDLGNAIDRAPGRAARGI